MTEEADDKVVKLFPDVSKIEEFPKSTQDRILIENRDEMKEVLAGMIGRIEAFDIRGLVIVALAKNNCDDTTFVSNHAYVDVARTVGALEFMKQAIIDNRLREVEYQDE